MHISHSDYIRAHSFRRRASRGMTLVELLAATLIMAVSLIAMVGSWLYMMTSTITIDDQAGAYQVARQVIDRVRNVGYFTYYNTQPQTLNMPDSNGLTTWVSPEITANQVVANDQGTRYFSREGLELGCNVTGCQPEVSSPPAGTHYMAVTNLYFTSAGTAAPMARPANRPDLNLTTIVVNVYIVESNGTVEGYPSGPAYTTATVLSSGGL